MTALQAVHVADPRPLPHAVEVERRILGALVHDGNLLSDVVDVLPLDAMHAQAHGLIYRAMLQLHDRRDPVDLVTVTQQLRENGTLTEVGGPIYLAEMSTDRASLANIRHHALIVTEKFIKRQIIAVSERSANKAYSEDDVFDTLSDASEAFMRLNQVAATGERTAADVADEVVNHSGPDRGMKTHFVDLDAMLRLDPGTVNIVGARPGMGKTAFALSIGWRTIAYGKDPVYFASLEMKNTGLVNRLICGECGIPVWKAKRRMLNDVETERMARFAMDNHEALKRLLLDEQASMDTSSLAARIDRAKRRHGIKLVIVDYLQLLNVRGERFKDRYSRVTAVSERLRIIAKDTDLPILALSQLSRSKTGGQKPSMSDLRESGQIEQDAETIMLLYREAYYNNDAPNHLEVIVAKNRDGADGSVMLDFDAQGARVVDLANMPMPANAPHPDNHHDDAPF